MGRSWSSIAQAAEAALDARDLRVVDHDHRDERTAFAEDLELLRPARRARGRVDRCNDE
jgi:hypothetical protein